MALEITDLSSSKGNSPSNGAEVNRQASTQDYVAVLMRGRWTILFAVLLVTVAVGVFTFLMKPTYEATSSVLIDLQGKAGTMPFLDITGTAVSNKITNELETLKSWTVAEGVARSLIDRAYIDTVSKQPIFIIRRVNKDNEVDGIASVDTITLRLRKAVEFQPVRDSDILRITARSIDPREAALIANTYMQVYTERNINTSRLKSHSVREFLQTQLSEKHYQLDTTERSLQNYMRKSGVVSLDDEAKKLVDQVAQLEAARDANDVEISALTKTLNSLKQEQAVQQPNVAKAMNESNDAYIRLIQDQLAKLEVQRDVAIAQSKSGNESVDKVQSEQLREIDMQIASMKRSLKERTTVFLSSLLASSVSQSTTMGATSVGGTYLAQVEQKIAEGQIELDGLKAKKSALTTALSQYEKQFNQIPEKSIELAKLQRARLSTEKLYLMVEENYNAAAIAETSEFGYLNVIDPAKVPLTPVSPRPVVNISLGLLVGLFLGIGTVLLRARVDDRIRTPEDLKRFGGAPLSTIFKMDAAKKGTRSTEGLKDNKLGFDSRVVTFFNPFSPISEAFRHLRTNVQYAMPDSPLNSLMVTSANPQEGKSTVSANLAVAFSQTEGRVLLVDADMRRPTVHSVFGLRKEPGLTNVLFGRSSFEEVVNRQVVNNLDILTCGTIPPNPAEILASRKMREFVDSLTKTYDVVLFDAPPLLAVTDSSVLARHVDGIVVVASSGNTTSSALQRAVESLNGVRRKLLGFVLNNFDVKEVYGGYYGSYKQGYGYGYGPAKSNGKKHVSQVA